jgi:hypothetical protein
VFSRKCVLHEGLKLTGAEGAGSAGGDGPGNSPRAGRAEPRPHVPSARAHGHTHTHVAPRTHTRLSGALGNGGSAQGAWPRPAAPIHILLAHVSNA